MKIIDTEAADFISKCNGVVLSCELGRDCITLKQSDWNEFVCLFIPERHRYSDPALTGLGIRNYLRR